MKIIIDAVSFERGLITRRLSQTLLLLSIPLLQGCALMPAPPSLAFPKATRNGIHIINSSRDLSQVAWWKKMRDPLLNQLIRDALANNNQLKTAQANVLQAEAQLKAARWAWFPTLNAGAGGFVGGGWDSDFTPRGPLAQLSSGSTVGNLHFRGYFSGFVPRYSLNALDTIYKNKFAASSLEMQRAAYLSTRLSIISQVTGAYFMLLGEQAQLKEQSNLVRDLKKSRRLEWVRYQEGSSDLTVVTDLDKQIVTNQASLTSIENSLSQVENAIQLLLNRNPGPLVKMGDIHKLSVRELIPPNISSAVLTNRPDLIMAMQNLKRSESNVGVAYSNFFPTISLTGLLGSSSAELSHLLSLSTGLWIAEAAASIPLLNGVSFEQIKEAKAGYFNAYFTYIQTVKNVFADVDNSLTNQQKMNTSYHYQLNALNAAKITQALALARYQEGLTDYRDVLTAALAVDSAKIAVILAKMQQLDAIVEVYQALAGGDRVCV